MTVRIVALAAAALAGAATLATGGAAHAVACPPIVNPQVCAIAEDPVPDRCVYYPDTGEIECWW